MNNELINIVNPIVKVEEFDPDYIIRKIEKHARRCYKTEDSTAPLGDLLEKRLLKSINKGRLIKMIHNGEMDVHDLEKAMKVLSAPVHSSVMEHANISVSFLTNRGMTHELVRHRIGVAFSQESTRYCNYSKDKFGKKITVLRPYYAPSYEMDNVNVQRKYLLWERGMSDNAYIYFEMLKELPPEAAREELSNSTKTEIDCTLNINAWRHCLALRSSQKAHPEIRRSMAVLLSYFTKMLPILFTDIYMKNIYPYLDDMPKHFPGINDVDLQILNIEDF